MPCPCAPRQRTVRRVSHSCAPQHTTEGHVPPPFTHHHRATRLVPLPCAHQHKRMEQIPSPVHQSTGRGDRFPALLHGTGQRERFPTFGLISCTAVCRATYRATGGVLLCALPHYSLRHAAAASVPHHHRAPVNRPRTSSLPGHTGHGTREWEGCRERVPLACAAWHRGEGQVPHP